MRSADSGQSTRNDLAALGYKAGEQAHVLVVDGVDLLHAELADLLAAKEFASAFASGAPWASGTSAAFATRSPIRTLMSACGGCWCRCIRHVSPQKAASY